MGVDVNEILDLAFEETGLKECVEDCLLGNEFVADRVADGLSQLVAMAGNHALWPDSDAEEFYRFVWMKEHPNRQPCRAVSVNGGDDNDCCRNQDFEG